MNANTTNAIDALGDQLGNTALTLLVKLYPAVREANDTQLEAACAAMRTKAKSVVDQFLDAAKGAPSVAHLALQTAALTLAHEGIQVLQAAGK